MSRLAGRLSVAGEGDNEANDARNRRMFAGMLGHLNSEPSTGSRNFNSNWRLNRSDHTEETRNLPERKSFNNKNEYRSNGNERGRNNRGRGWKNDNRRSNPAQSTLNNDERPKVHSRKSVALVENVEPVEELLDLDDIISQISDLNVRSDRSAAQIKRNITNSKELIETMDEEEWEKLCEILSSTAIEQGEYDFIVDLFVSLLGNELFSETMSSELMSIASNHIMKKGETPVPTFLASILCGHWPRQYAKAIDTVNLILYSTACIIKGWIQVLENDNSKFYKPQPKVVHPSSIPVNEENSSQNVQREKNDDETNEEDEDPEIVNSCALALCELCEANQRQLWMKWPTYCDEIYMCIKPAITHNQNLSGETKMRLLNTYLQINNWTKAKAITTKNNACQTVPE